MLRIAVCCGGGMSSSTMAEHFNKQIAERGLGDEVSLLFIPFRALCDTPSGGFFAMKTNRQEEVDVAMLCPHLEFPAKRAHAEGTLHIPAFVMPMRMYGPIDVEDLIEDARDVIALWEAGQRENPVTFADEPRSMVAKRKVSHRKWAAGR